MAHVKYSPAMPSDLGLPNNAGRLLDHGDNFAELTTMTSDTMVFVGQGFTYDNDAFVGGTVNEIVFRASDLDFYRVTGIDWDVASRGLLASVGGDADFADLFGGNDTFVGSSGQDYLYGWGGRDFIRGGRGDDIIRGGEGNDVLRGGKGSDTFVFAVGDGIDRIRDFDTSGPVQDVIRISGIEDISDVGVSQRGKHVVIAYGDDMIILRHTDLDDLSFKNFAQARHFDFDFG